MERDIAEAARDIAKRWLPALMEGLDACTDEEQRKRIMEFCGRGDELLKESSEEGS